MKNVRTAVLVAFLLSLVAILPGVAADTWTKTYGSGVDSLGHDVLLLEDGGYLVVGETAVDGEQEGVVHLLLMKLDDDGDVVWERTYAEERASSGAALLAANDGGYVIAGAIQSDHGSDADIYLLRVDEDGTELWSRSFGTSWNEFGGRLLETADGGYVIVGNSVDPNDIVADPSAAGYAGFAGRSSVYIVRTDEDGNEIWSRRVASEENVIASGGAITTDGGIVVLSHALYYPVDDNDIRLLKLDGDGNEVWSRTWEEGKTSGYDFLATSDGGYLISGARSFPEDPARTKADALLIKVDADGNELWVVTYGEPDRVETAHAVAETSDGQYVCVGWQLRDLYTHRDDIYLVGFAADGSLLWETVTPTDKHNMHEALVQHADGSLVIGGSVAQPGQLFRMQLIKTVPPGVSDPAGWLPVSDEITGRLSEIDGIPVLHVWGTPREQGYAIGTLLGPEVVGLYDRLIAYQTWDLNSQRWNDEVLPAAQRFTLAPEYLAEFEGMLQGIESRAGGPAEVPSLGRDLQIEDLVAASYVYDDKRLGCTSLAAWGSMTEDGRTLYGRNMDWPALPAFLEAPQIVIVRAPWPDSGRLATVSVFFPLIIGVNTAMNAHGTVMCNNDAYNERDPVRRSGFFPAPLSNRTALETARAGTAYEDILMALRAEPSGVGRSLTVSMPPGDNEARGLVFEADGIWGETGGVIVRMPEPTQSFILTTMHHRERGEPIDCRYYEIGEQALLAVSRGQLPPLTVATTWDLLTALTPTGGLTYHSVIFEPDSMRMHVRLQEDGVTAQQCRSITLDVEALLRELPGAGDAE